ncbi:hypothetical protein [Roseixanthobacter glucoisosaccharinicivorans]|uniref:hypothetical protein n=1 Tax=Roseixanthobacter glucoisosaccharinicivorans TaxID=3119923 RepID=UPI00372951A1
MPQADGTKKLTGTPQDPILGSKNPVDERHRLRAGGEIVFPIEGLDDLRVRPP